MKKTYNTPEVKVVEVENANLIATSPGANNAMGNGTQLEDTYRSNLWGDD